MSIYQVTNRDEIPNSYVPLSAVVATQGDRSDYDQIKDLVDTRQLPAIRFVPSGQKRGRIYVPVNIVELRNKLMKGHPIDPAAPGEKSKSGLVPEGDVRLSANVRADLHMKLRERAIRDRTTVGELIEGFIEKSFMAAEVVEFESDPVNSISAHLPTTLTATPAFVRSTVKGGAEFKSADKASPLKEAPTPTLKTAEAEPLPAPTPTALERLVIEQQRTNALLAALVKTWGAEVPA